jgi:hypothetical protein
MTVNGIELNFTMLEDGSGYILNKKIVYYSNRYDKYITLPEGMYSDGATFAEDIVSLAPWVHDRLRGIFQWDDGSKCSNWQASNVLRDILLSEKRYIRCNRWFIATLIFGWMIDIKRCIFYRN